MSRDASTGWVPESCALPSANQPRRLAEFDRLFRASVRRVMRVSATRLDLVLGADAESAARDLAAREVLCCSFFTFEFASAGTEVVMSIGVPRSHTEILDAVTERVGPGVDAARGAT